MGLFEKLKTGLQKTHSRLVHEIKRIVTGSPKLTAATLEELEAALIAADLGMAMTSQIVTAVKHAYETQGGAGLDVFAIAQREVEKSLSTGIAPLANGSHPPVIVSIVGVNGTGKTTTSAKLAHLLQARGVEGCIRGSHHERCVNVRGQDMLSGCTAGHLAAELGASRKDGLNHGLLLVGNELDRDPISDLGKF